MAKQTSGVLVFEQGSWALIRQRGGDELSWDPAESLQNRFVDSQQRTVMSPEWWCMAMPSMLLLQPGTL